MRCDEVRTLLVPYQRHALEADDAARVRAHLESCAACSSAEAAEHALTEVLEHRMPQHPAPIALKRRLAAGWPAAPVRRRPSAWSRWTRSMVPALAALVLLVALPLVYWQRSAVEQTAGTRRLVDEAITDHLRVLSSSRPVDIQSGGIHQVKPWFEGKLDFAPVVGFEGDREFALEGGAVGYFVDRKAAIFVYRRRLHMLSLFVFRADGFAWPSRGLEPIGGARAYTKAERGFEVILWHAGGLGYALVGDVAPADLRALAARLTAPS